MDQSGLIGVIVFVLVVVVGGLLLYLYLDYRTGQEQARASRQREQPPAPPVQPPPSAPPSSPPRIVFGPTSDARPDIIFEARGEQTGRICPVCRRPIAAEEYTADRIIICPSCRNHIHVECWEYSTSPGNCPVCGR